MLNPFLANNNLDEVVFANRNKSYGAYAIRKQYDTHVTRSLLIVFSAFLALFLIGLLLRAAPPVAVPAVDKAGPVILDNIIIELPPVSPPVAVNPISVTTGTDNGNYHIDVDRNVVKTVTKTPPVPINNTLPVAPSGNTAGGGLLGKGTLPGPITPPVLVAPPPAVPITTAEIMPLFDNGNSDLYEYLSRQISYPQRAAAAGISGKVIVSFDIDQEGNVMNIFIRKGIGFGCDEEAIRVVKNMPRWKPASQNGNAVIIRMSLPIMFQMQ